MIISSFKKLFSIYIPFLGISIFCVFSTSLAIDVSLTWKSNTETDLAGYNLYYKAGSSGPPYSVKIDVGNATTYKIEKLSDEETYYFVVTAYDHSNLESDYSNEVRTVRVLKITSSTPNGSYTEDRDIDIIIYFSETLTLQGGNLVITMDTGRSIEIEPFTSEFCIRGNYKVQKGEVSNDLNVISLGLSGGELKNNKDLNCHLSLPKENNLADNKDIIIKKNIININDKVYDYSASGTFLIPNEIPGTIKTSMFTIIGICGNCHSLPPGTHIPNETNCSMCHPTPLFGVMPTDLYHMNGILDLLEYMKSAEHSAPSMDLLSPMNDLIVVPDPRIYGFRSPLQLEQSVFTNSMYGMAPNPFFIVLNKFDYLLASLSANNMSYSLTIPYEPFFPLYNRQYLPLSLSNYFQVTVFPGIQNIPGLIAPLPPPCMVGPYSVTNFLFSRALSW